MTATAKFTLTLENDRLLNGVDFVQFCHGHQHQNIELTVNNEGHCLTHTGVYNILDDMQFASVTIKTSNRLEDHERYSIDRSRWLQWFDSINFFDREFDFTWSEQKVFGTVYGRPTAPRLGIVAHLKSNHDDQSLLLTKFNLGNEDFRKLFDLQRLFAWHPQSLYQLRSLEQIAQHDLPYQRAGLYDYSNPIYRHYRDFLIDLVAEPVYEGRSFYPTEKIVRPILYQRPFIVMATRDYLLYLRSMGFRTFSEFWDEDYDGYEGKDRYLMILQLIDQIAAKSSRKMLDLYHGCQEIIQHNFNRLMDHYHKKVMLDVRL